MMPIACAWAAAALFAADVAMHLTAIARRREMLRRVTKVLLMPLLALAFLLFWLVLSQAALPWIVIAALMLGCAGDTLLLNHHHRIGLPVGLACFSAGHVLYIVQIWRLVTPPAWRAAALIALLYIAVAGLFYRKLFPHLPGKFRMPALLYTLLLTALSASAAMAAFSLRLGASVVWVGTLLFMLSDSILSFEVFRGESSHGNLKVMSSYIAAQACLSAGFLLWAV